MAGIAARRPRLTERDLDFVVETAAPDFSDKPKLKRLILEDQEFRRGLVGDEKLFRKVMDESDIALRISPTLYFEILLRRALRDLEQARHTVERSGTQAVPVFDTKEVVDLLSRQPVLDYLTEMLSSFTKVESYTIPIRVRAGIWRKIRFSDMDVDSLIRLSEVVDEEHRLTYYKRIGDVCLFILGMFPEHVQFDYRYPASGELRPKVAGRVRRGMEEYEAEGRRFYKLAAEHPAARDLDLSEVFWILHGKFNAARKPVSFISDHYLHFKKHEIFGSPSDS